MKALMQWGARCLHAVDATGLERIPAQGRYLVATNHAGVRGALLLGALLEREIVFVVSARFLSVPGAAAIARGVGGIFVSPGDMLGLRMLRECSAALDRGALLGVMTEGRLMNGRYGPPKRGASYLAARLQLGLWPVSIRLRGPTARIRVGALLPAPAAVDRRSLDAATDRLAEQLRSVA